MKAVILRAFGEPDELRVEDAPRPSPGPEEVLVQIRACGICHLDLILRSGMRSRVTLPRVLGHELAGEVVEVGADVTALSPGDRVASFNFRSCGTCDACRRGRPSLCRAPLGDIGQTCDGGYAEFAALPAENLVPVPNGLPLKYACLAACVYGPPYKAIRRVGQLHPGETLVVTGASGGLGTATIQIAKAVGARILAVTTSPSKVGQIKALGPDAVIVNHDGNFGQQVRDLTNGWGADVLIDLVGSALFPGSLRSLAPGGRYVAIGELHGKPIELNLGLLVIKEWEFYGVQSASREDLKEVLDFMCEHNIQPIIWKSISLDQVAEAHRDLAVGHAIGRAVLTF